MAKAPQFSLEAPDHLKDKWPTESIKISACVGCGGYHGGSVNISMKCLEDTIIDMRARMDVQRVVILESQLATALAEVERRKHFISEADFRINQ